ncbi:MAG: hypothetical protein K8S54_04825 [Spirochaetia bacterium]|nr:hypothetical protein [Spirochaetia bacterium]
MGLLRYVILPIVLASLAGNAQANPLILKSNSTEVEDQIDLTPYIETAIPDSPDAALTQIERMTWQGGYLKPPNFARKFTVVWARFRIENRSDSNLERILEISAPWTDRIDVHCSDGASSWHSAMGDTLPFSERPIFHRHPAIKLSIRVNSNLSCYLRLESQGRIVIPVDLYSRRAFETKSISEYTLLGLYFGGMFTILAFSLVLIFLIRIPAHVWYCLYVSNAWIYFAFYNGVCAQFLFPDATWISAATFMLAVTLNFTLLWFARKFLGTRTNLPRVDLLGRAYCFSLLGLIAVFFIEEHMAQVLLALSFTSTVFILLVLILMSIYHGVWRAGYFLGATSVLIVSIFAGSALHQARLDWSVPVEYFFQAGTFIEVVLFGIVMGARVRRVFKNRQQGESTLSRHALELRRLLGAMNDTSEKERKSIARELQSGFDQPLRMLGEDLDTLRNAKRTEAITLATANRMDKSIDSLVVYLRALLGRIKPPLLDEMGLSAALEYEAAAFSKRTGIDCDFLSALSDKYENEKLPIFVFRIFKEGLALIERFASPGTVTGRAWEEAGLLHLTLGDNGTALPDNEPGVQLGLAGMRERTEHLGGSFRMQVRGEERFCIGIPLQKPATGRKQ